MRIKFYVALVFFVLLIYHKSFSQSGTYGNNILTEKPNTPIDSMMNGYIEILPADYASHPSKRYPLLIFLEGVSQFGDGSPADLPLLYGQNEGMLPDIVRQNLFPNSYLIGSTTYEFIVIVPQIRKQVQNGRSLPDQMLLPGEVNDIVNYALQNYRVEVKQVYLSGLSIGGGSTWNYPGQSVTYGNRLAAIVPFSGASNLWDNHSRVTNISQANLPIWTFVVSGDHPYDTLAQRYIDSIQTHPIHTTDALITVYAAGGHNSWEQPLEGGNTLMGGNTGGTGYPSNIYVWMLGKSRSSLTQPVFATVNAGSDQTLNLPNGSMVLAANGISFTGATVTLNGSATAISPRTISNILWVKVNGNSGTITNPNALSTTVTGLKPGFYSYQLRATDDQGLTSVSNVNITVNAPPENKYKKIEAEAFSALNSGGSAPNLDKSMEDQGPASGLGSLDGGHWAEYAVTLPTAGTYALYTRYTSPYNNPGVQIIVNGLTTYTQTLISDNTWRSDSIHVNLSTNNTIRFFTPTSNTPWNFNYFELVQISSQAPLPLKFVYFNSQCRNGGVTLEWRTAEEVNSKNFEIQRSTDGISWTWLISLLAAGQSSIERGYQYSDNTASASNNFYRIIEHDFDGRTTVSTIIKGSCSSRHNEFSVSPNPSSGTSALNISLEQSTKIIVTIVDSKGALIQHSQVMLPAGNTTLPLNMSSFAQGVYSININYNSETKTIKIIKK